MKPHWYLRWRVTAVLFDIAFVGGALCALTVARFGVGALRDGFVPAPGRAFARAPLLIAIPVWIAVFALTRLYSPQRCQTALEEGRRLVTGALVSAVALVMIGFLVKENPARSWLFGSIVFGTLGAAMGRRTLRQIVAGLRSRGKWMTPTVVVGRVQAKSVVESITAHRESGILPVAVCGLTWPGLPSWRLDQIADAVATTQSNQVLVVSEGLERSEVGAAVEVADDLPVHIVVLPGLDHVLLGSIQLVTVVHEPGVALEPSSSHRVQVFVKRAMDVFAGSILLLLSAPLVLGIAIGVKLTSSGPVLYKQKRFGRHGTQFDLLKFRSMRERADSEALESVAVDVLSKPKKDPRITRFGHFIRRTSLDETPQLWNVIRGDMSLVGPRPLAIWEGERLGLRRRLIVRPGLTGLWQVSGRSTVSAEERIRLDLVYVQNWSLLLDLSILIRTVPAVIGGRGAY